MLGMNNTIHKGTPRNRREHNGTLQHDPLRALVNELIVYKGVCNTPRVYQLDIYAHLAARCPCVQSSCCPLINAHSNMPSTRGMRDRPASVNRYMTVMGTVGSSVRDTRPNSSNSPSRRERVVAEVSTLVFSSVNRMPSPCKFRICITLSIFERPSSPNSSFMSTPPSSKTEENTVSSFFETATVPKRIPIRTKKLRIPPIKT